MVNVNWPTQYTSIEFYTHGNMPIPGSDIHTSIASCKRLKQTMGNNEVSFLIGWEDLFEVIKEINGKEFNLLDYS